MAVNVKNAFVGSPAIDGGVFFRAPLGTALPTDAKSKLDEASRTTALSVRTA